VNQVVVSLDRFRATKNIQTSLEISLGEQISITRRNQGLSQEDLGRRVGYSQSAISRIESGDVQTDATCVALIAGALGSERLLTAYCQRCPVAAARCKMQPKPAA